MPTLDRKSFNASSTLTTRASTTTAIPAFDTALHGVATLPPLNRLLTCGGSKTQRTAARATVEVPRHPGKKRFYPRVRNSEKIYITTLRPGDKNIYPSDR